jgi:polyhydroxyalkanoate synthesis regulator phasin
MQDAWRAYLELALGLAEAPRRKAQDAVRRVVGTGGATAAQLQALAEELVSTSAANREALTKLVRFEVDRALGAVGLATADEVAELTRRVRDLERQLREARATESSGATTAGGPSADATPQPDPTRAAQPGDGLVPSDSPAGAPVAQKAAPPVAEKAPAPVAKKAIAKKAVAKKAIARKPPATISRTGDETQTPVSQDDTPTPADMPAKKAVRKRRPDGAS